MRAKLTDEQVAEIRERGARGERSAALSREFGVADSTISRLLTGKLFRSAPGPVRPAGAPRTCEQIATARAGQRRGVRSFTDAEVVEIRELHASGVGVGEIARMWGLTDGGVSRIVTGAIYRSAGGPIRPAQPTHRLTERQVYEIRLWVADGASDVETAAEFGVSRTTVAHIRRGDSRKMAPGPVAGREKRPPTAVQVVWEIRRRLAAGESQRSIAAATGASKGTVSDIATGRTHYHTPSEVLPAPGQ